MKTLRTFVSVITLAAAASTLAGPQHFGFGMSYFTTIQNVAGKARLVVYEAPVRAKDTPWIVRWLDRSPSFGNIVPGGIAVGDYWTSDVGKAYLAVITKAASGYQVKVLNPPEMFTTKPWQVLSTSALNETNLLQTCAGDPLGSKRDQLVVLAGKPGAYRLDVFAAPAAPSQTGWNKVATAVVPNGPGKLAGMACGDFWGEKKNQIALAWSSEGKTRVSYYTLSTDGLKLIVNDAATDIPPIKPFSLVATDYVKDKFDTLTFVPVDPKVAIQVRVAPLKSSTDKPNPGPIYSGKAYSRAWLPGAGLSKSTLVMKGRLTGAGELVATSAGQLFGYSKVYFTPEIRTKNAIDEKPDAEIAFTHRTPTYSLFAGAPNFGWPSKGETFTYEVNLKNNGKTAIPTGKTRVKVWINTPYRNADTNPLTCDKPDAILSVDEPLRPFTTQSLRYAKVVAEGKWPYSLIDCGPGATWKKINLEEVGERWMVFVLECDGDTNPRNNRIEAALHAWTLHPNYRSNKSFEDRQPTMAGDPPSVEYLNAKLADALTCMWERSGTTDNQDVLQCAFFDGYEIGWPSDQPGEERDKKWRAVQDKYEGWREFDLHFGNGQGWERFDWGDGAAELHEAGHLFHPMGDLYQYAFSPVWSGATAMEDGTPVQFSTYCWGPDSFSINWAMIGPPTCDFTRKYWVGYRGLNLNNWFTVASDKIKIRVLDRQGKPVANAKVSLFAGGNSKVAGAGFTDANGLWDTGFPKGEKTLDVWGVQHYTDPGPGFAQIVTVAVNGYQEASIVGMESMRSYGVYTRFGMAMLDPKEWIWDFKTNYSETAPKPDFTVEAAIQGSVAELGISGPPDAKYRLYRRWEPANLRTVVGNFSAQGSSLRIKQDMAEADSHRGGRFRATYEVTRIISQGEESLPRALSVTGLNNVKGITTLPDRSMIVAANSGIANPLAILLKGTTPYRELIYHYRFGHTATKLVASALVQGRYYATLSFSDMQPDYRFDVINPPDPNNAGYDTRNDIRGLRAESFSTSAPYTMRLEPKSVGKLNPNDQIGESKILSIKGDIITLDKPFFRAGQGDLGFDGARFAGQKGNRAEARELSEARGLTSTVIDGKEYVAIADTGNNRLVVWNDATTFITLFTIPGFHPVAVANDPSQPGQLIVLDRRPDGQSSLVWVQFDGQKLKQVGPSVPISVGDLPGEMGLAVTERGSKKLLIAVTDASTGKVVVGSVVSGKFDIEETISTAIGTVAGEPKLTQPMDLAFISLGGSIQLFATDGGNRVVRLK